MKLEYLEYISVLGQYPSINQAAERLCLSPQALSKCIKGMESEMGLTLISRSSRGIRLTAEGAEIAAMSRRVVNDYARTLKKLQKKTELAGDLFLCVHDTVLSAFFREDINEFALRHPRLRISTVQENVSTVSRFCQLNRLQKESCSHLIFSGKFIPDHKGFGPLSKMYGENSFIPVTNLIFPFYLCVGNEHPLSGVKEVSLKTIVHYPVIQYVMGDEMEINGDALLLNQYGTPQIARCVDSVHGMICAIESGIGIGLVNESIFQERSSVSHLFKSVTLIKIKEKPKMQMGFFVPADLSRQADAFIQYIQEKY